MGRKVALVILFVADLWACALSVSQDLVNESTIDPDASFTDRLTSPVPINVTSVFGPDLSTAASPLALTSPVAVDVTSMSELDSRTAEQPIDFNLQDRVRIYLTPETSYNWSRRFDDRDSSKTFTVALATKYRRDFYLSLSIQQSVGAVMLALEEFLRQEQHQLKDYFFE